MYICVEVQSNEYRLCIVACIPQPMPLPVHSTNPSKTKLYERRHVEEDVIVGGQCDGHGDKILVKTIAEGMFVKQ